MKYEAHSGVHLEPVKKYDNPVVQRKPPRDDPSNENHPPEVVQIEVAGEGARGEAVARAVEGDTGGSRARGSSEGRSALQRRFVTSPPDVCCEGLPPCPLRSNCFFGLFVLAVPKRGEVRDAGNVCLEGSRGQHVSNLFLNANATHFTQTQCSIEGDNWTACRRTLYSQTCEKALTPARLYWDHS